MGSLEQKKLLQKSAGIKVCLGIALVIVGYALLGVFKNGPLVILALPLMLAAVVLYYWGLGQYCVSKGYSGVLAIAGILGLLGLILLLILPDKYQVQAPPVVEGSYPRPAPGSVSTIV